MCPDENILSALLDGEIEEPWGETLEQHVAQCAACKRKLRSFQTVAHVLLEANEPDLRGAKSKIWRRLDISRLLFMHRPLFWGKRIVVPLPLAAGILLAVGALSISFLFSESVRDFRLMHIKREPSGATEVRVAAPIKDLELLLSSLEQRGVVTRKIIMELPEDSQFLMIGKPAILRETELRRR